MVVRKQELELDMKQQTASKVGKECQVSSSEKVHQGCVLSSWVFNLYTEYIMQNAGLDESQARIKTVRRNINNLRYANDTTLMAEHEEELKNLLMKVKQESETAGLKLNIQKTKIMASALSLHGK